MAINPNREQARLNKTKELAKKVQEEIDAAVKQLEGFATTLDQMQVSTTLNENKITFLREEKEKVEAKEAKDQDDLNQIAAAQESIAKLEADNSAISLAYAAESKTANETNVKLQKLKASPILAQLASQEAALSRAGAAYPAKLKRHLRKCRQHGWADARLGGKK